jgi:hypothetical protein
MLGFRAKVWEAAMELTGVRTNCIGMRARIRSKG